MPHRGLAYIYGVLPPMFWAGNFLLARLMRDQIPPFQMSFWRWVVAFVVLLPFALRHLSIHWGTVRREWWFLMVLGLVGVTAFNCFIYSAFHYTTIVNAGIINSLMPVMTCLIAMVLLKEHLSVRQVAGIVLAICGTTVILSRGNPLELLSLTFNPGDILVLFGLTFWACYTVLIRWQRTNLPLVLFLTVTIGFGVLFHIPLLVYELQSAGSFILTSATLGSILFFALFPSIFAYFLWNRAVHELGPTRTGMFMYLLPIFSSILGVIFLGEAFLLFHGIGILLIFAGMALVSNSTVRKDKESTAS